MRYYQPLLRLISNWLSVSLCAYTFFIPTAVSALQHMESFLFETLKGLDHW